MNKDKSLMQKNLPSYSPVYITERGEAVESVRFGAAAVVNSKAEVIAGIGDPQAVTFLRSTAKPFQVMPFLENSGADLFRLSELEVSVMCSSHSGTDEHVEVIRGIQTKTGVSETELLCGIHYPIDNAQREKMLIDGEEARPNHHNCSGMHTALISREKMMEEEDLAENEKVNYTEQEHQVQEEILSAVSNMSSLPVKDTKIGTDGCSVPTFGLPLKNAALAYARLCDPENGAVLPGERAAACRLIFSSMIACPEMVAGPGRFDTCLMQAARGGIVSKSGAEGVHAIGLMPGFLEPGSPGIGVFIKISDGDEKGDAGPAVAIALLDALGALDSKMKSDLSGFGPDLPVLNCSNYLVGRGYPIFKLEFVENITSHSI